VIVNYRTAGLVCDCLQSLEPEIASLPGACVRVVDNDSQDGSAQRLSRFVEASRYGRWAQVLQAPRNGGFSYGNNFAIQQLLEEQDVGAFFLLNPDTYVRRGALKPLLEILDRQPKIGIVGSRLEDPDGTPHRSLFRFPSILGELEWSMAIGPVTRLLHRWAISRPPPDEPTACDWVAGASMLIRRAVFESIGLLDEGYFLYFEEVDYCLRAARAGWKCWYEPRSRVVHLVGAATGVSDARSAHRRLPEYWFDSRRRFFVKNRGNLYAAVADLSWMAGRMLGHTRRVLQRLPDRTPQRFLRDFARQSVFIRGFKL
jgi:GT2 family glycosyltransferase